MINSALNGKRVLVVDDEMHLREAIIFDLKRRGCEIFEASNGADALAIVKANAIDVVISDIRMPNGDGVFLLKEIRKYNSEIPIVLLCTGFADLSEGDAIKMGAVGLLEKPINRKNMLGILEKSVA
jgi:two-component system, sporulation sensor kinase A